MKSHKTYLGIIFLFLATFLFADSAKLNSKNKTDFTKLKKADFLKSHDIKSITNNDLKAELEQLENEFNKEYKYVRNVYKQKITDLKEQQKIEVKVIKKAYNKRRREIYKKYGVDPPKKVNKNENKDTLKLNKKYKNLPKTK